MRRFAAVLLLFSLFAIPALSADKKDKPKKDPIAALVGDWQGTVKVRNEPVVIIVHIRKAKMGNGLQATVDSPRQQLVDLPAQIGFFQGGGVAIVMPKLDATFRGRLNGDYTKLSGKFIQSDVYSNVTLYHAAASEDLPSIVDDEPDKPTVTTDFLGDWVGDLPIGDRSVRIVLHIRRNRSGTRASVDSPDQDTFGIDVTPINSDDKKLTFEIPSLKAKFEGIVDDYRATISGTYTQNGKSRPLVLTKS